VKFIESLASGAAVVSTAAGCEGFAAEGAFIQADDPEGFADACVNLLSDETWAMQIGSRGRDVAFSRYSWSQAARPILTFARRMDLGSSSDTP
jgi:glycosyltransferase involved in cell wall biosynthesis